MPDTPDDWKLDPYPEDLPSPTDFLDHEPGAWHRPHPDIETMAGRAMFDKAMVGPTQELTITAQALRVVITAIEIEAETRVIRARLAADPVSPRSPTMPDTPDFSTRGLERMRRRMTSDLGKKPASVLDADRLREAARNVGLPREVTVADIEDLAAEYDRLLAEPHDA
jgi:hypothetical protein